VTYNIANHKQVFIDWDLIEPGYGVAWGGKVTSWEMPFGIRLAVHPPRIAATPLVAADRPWETFVNVYCTLFEDEGHYRLYYEPHYHPEQTQAEDLKAMLAYAESTDGVHWTKPEIGAVSFLGSTANNLVFGLAPALGRGAHGGTVFKDPSAPADERYKYVHMGREDGVTCVFGATSSDGLHWTAIRQPLLSDYMSDTQTVVRFDPIKGRYVGVFRSWRGYLRGMWHGRRTIAYAETEDFRNWPRPQEIVGPDALDTPDADIYTNAYAPWPGTTDAHLMFPAFYQRSKDVLEVHLLTSRDAATGWQRISRQPVVPAGEPGSGWEGGVYAGCGLVALRPGEWSLPLGPQYHTHNQEHFAEGRLPLSARPHRGYICRAIWRQDGFTSLEAETEGGCTTVPLTFTGSSLALNVWTRFGGAVRVELAEPKGEVVPGRSFAECDPISGDCLHKVVTWGGQSDVSAWQGKPMRLRFKMKRARLHALQFVER
jgi:hypothetical protein